MKPIAPSDLLDNLNWRYATKGFDATRKIAPELWTTIEKATTLAPSSYGLQPWRFVVVNNPETRATLKGVSWNQPQITDASHLIVFCRKLEVTPADVDAYIEDISRTRNVPASALDGFKKMMLGSIASPASLSGGSMHEWTSRQVYIALGFFLSACANLGVDACPMEGFDASKYDQILGLTAQGYGATVVATAGYRSIADPIAAMKKVRFPLERTVKHV